jgi:subtilisin family serine protease
MVPSTAIDLGAKGKYIISVTPTAKAAVEAAVIKAGGKINNKYNYVFDGYMVELPKLIANLLGRIPNVLTVEEDAPVAGLAIQNTQSPTPSWGLDRIDQRNPVGQAGSVSAYGYRSAGKGATIYIGDTGIYPHEDLAGRISSSGYSAINDGNGTVDCNGHGTHVASTAAGTQYGIAKSATLVPIRILSCSGTGATSGVIAGLDWILSPENPNPKSAAVLNLSIGGGKSAAVNSSITRLTNAGIIVVAAAGNESTDACLRSPASAPSAITVGATMSNDGKSGFSNFGTCVDINAPGSSITGAWIGTPTSTLTINGTSMATPHVAGAAAVYLGLRPTASVLEVSNFLDAESTKDVLTGLPVGTPNKLLYVSPTDGGAPVVAPVVGLKSVTKITHQSADIAIDVNPGAAPTSLTFEYSVDESFSTTLTAPVLPGTVEGSSSQIAMVSLTGLTASVTYFFRITGANESGRTVSSIGSFATLAPPTSKPIATALPATDVTAYSARVSGQVSAGNALSTVTFVYSTDQSFATNSKTIDFFLDCLTSQFTIFNFFQFNSETILLRFD